MRSRNLKPGFFKNEELAEIDPIGRLLFQGLWCLADREGRLEDRPKRIKAEILPYDNVQVNKLLNELQSRNFIVRYSINGSNFIYIPTFKKHQSPHMKEQESTLPAPDMPGASMVQALEEHESSPPLTLNPLTETLNPIKDSAPSRGSGDNSVDFEAWWKAYPPRRKQSKPLTKSKWETLKRSGRLLPLYDMLRVLESQKTSFDWQKNNGDFIPGPLPYLNQLKFLDESIEAGVEDDPIAKCLKREMEGKQA